MSRHRITDLRVVYGKDSVEISPLTRSVRGARLRVPGGKMIIKKVAGEIDQVALLSGLAALYPETAGIDSS